MVLVNSSQKSSYSTAFKGNVELCNLRRGLHLVMSFQNVLLHMKSVYMRLCW